jgi:hypothetical protein
MGLALSMSFVSPVQAEDELIPYSDGKEKREKKLEFEGGLVEGLTKSPGDIGSLTIKDKYRKKDHIYNRKMIFDSELIQTIKDMRYEL